jgi:hypothetical protein
MTHEAGKGDKQRPTNYKSFSENFDNIFRKTEEELSLSMFKVHDIHVCDKCGAEYSAPQGEKGNHVCGELHE